MIANFFMYAEWLEPIGLCIVGYIALPTSLQGHATIAWWVDRSLLSMVGVGSISGMTRRFLISAYLVVRGQGRAAEITATK